MTVSTEISREEYTGNGVTTDFDYRFRVFSADELVVSVSDTTENISTLVLNTDYTVTGAGSRAGGKVKLVNPLANAWRISIERDLPVTQETDIRNQGNFFPEVHEDAFDKLTMLIQQAFGVFGLALRKPNWLARYYDAKGNRIVNLGNPVNGQDAATKQYVDSTNDGWFKRTIRVPENYVEQVPTVAGRQGRLFAWNNAGSPIAVHAETDDGTQLEIDLAGADGQKYIGRTDSLSVLRSMEPERDKQLISVSADSGHSFMSGGRMYVSDMADTTTQDDSGINVVTSENRRWKLARESDSIKLEWFKWPENTWDDAWTNLIAYCTNLAINIPKIVVPMGRITYYRPIILPWDRDWVIEGCQGHGISASVMRFDIPKSVAIANGWQTTACITHFGTEWRTSRLSLRYVAIDGSATTIRDPLIDEASFAYMHGVKCRTTGTIWEDVPIQNFRGAGLWLDNSFDCTYNRTSVFASGRMLDGYDYNNPAHVANEAACEYSPVYIMSSRGATGGGDTDACNYLSFYGGSYELNNCTPILRVEGGIQLQWFNLHSERPGRSWMSASWPMGTFAKIDGEAWFYGCGTSNYAKCLSLGRYSQINIVGCSRLGGSVSAHSSDSGSVRFRATNSIFGGDFTIPITMPGDWNFYGCTFIGSLQAQVMSGSTTLHGCRINGDLNVLGTSYLPANTAGGVQIIGTTVQGNFTSAANAQRVSFIGGHVIGNFSMLGSLCSEYGTSVLGTRTNSPYAASVKIDNANPPPIYITSAITEISGTIQRGTLILKRAPNSMGSPGWICTSSGTPTTGVFSQLPNLIT
ncbi:hypothetical protein SFB10_3555 [Serratia liquefaciens]|uniref:hypothetical protein n=1 Tax=Serratia liquefaciens TaxID=614 RepID=UPI00141D161F|nr:hypothetical protein [Serratia liquefaciens]CAB1223419.1 hypothetical protein SFB10_3555 [Serratia liquefaciens]